MKIPSMLVVARPWAVIGALTLSLWAASCASPKGSGAGDRSVFDLSETQRRSRFPKVQNIGVVELSGARIAVRPHGKNRDEQAYAATGGAYLVKKVDSPILATAPEILVTPDSAILKGPAARVLKNGQVYIAETVDSVITIDGTRVSATGPHRIESLETWKKQPAPVIAKAPAPAPVPAPATVQVPASPQTAARPVKVEKPKAQPTPAPAPAVVKKENKASASPPRQPAALAPEAPPVVKKTPAQPAAKPVVASKPVARPSPAPKSAPKPVEKVDRKELLNLMRAPSD